MAHTYKNEFFALDSTSITTIYTVPSNTNVVIKSVQIASTHNSNVLVTLSVTSGATTYTVYNHTVSTGSTVNGVEGSMVLEAGDVLKITAATADVISGIVSYLAIT
jgi:predicted metal-dependent enzyme (double-stranded beta helix superfamily)|tara:strand:+ start:58 stop:375 length:318 start_codon:yes stop_codon:yes gene_type:complete